MTALERNPVGVSVAGIAALMAVLVVLALTVPMSGNAEHFSGHLAMGIPLLLLLVLVLRAWPRPGSELAARLARGTLLAGLGVAGVGLLAEGIGAFGYAADESGRANALADLHAVGVGIWPVGFVLLLAGAVMTTGVLLAARRGAAGSRIVTSTAVVAVAAAVAFLAGGFIFGY
jgi:hypothetical protein